MTKTFKRVKRYLQGVGIQRGWNREIIITLIGIPIEENYV